MKNHSIDLRREILTRAEHFVSNQGLEPYVYRSRGRPAVVLFKPYTSKGRKLHGNFHSTSYANILENAEWKKRLAKPHPSAGRGSFAPADSKAAKELDSCTSSDALLMNVFCHPSITANKPLAALFGLDRLLSSEFGFKACLPFVDGESEPRSTEVDLRLCAGSRTILIESKLTEADFTSCAKSKAQRYAGFAEVFASRLLKSGGEKFLHYQLLRNVLAAHYFNASFYLLCDRRRPDLIEALEEVCDAITQPALKKRCAAVTWQQVAATLPIDLRRFLAEKYGV